MRLPKGGFHVDPFLGFVFLSLTNTNAFLIGEKKKTKTKNLYQIIQALTNANGP
jgi:hypothetical protein